MKNIFPTYPALFTIALTSILFFSACTNDNEEDLFGDCGDLSSMSLSENIRPILSSQCFACHSSDQMQGGIDLESFSSLQELASGGRLAGAINHLAGYAAMPPTGIQLDKCEIEKIEAWIEQGALNN